MKNKSILQGISSPSMILVLSVLLLVATSSSWRESRKTSVVGFFVDAFSTSGVKFVRTHSSSKLVRMESFKGVSYTTNDAIGYDLQLTRKPTNTQTTNDTSQPDVSSDQKTQQQVSKDTSSKKSKTVFFPTPESTSKKSVVRWNKDVLMPSSPNAYLKPYQAKNGHLLFKDKSMDDLIDNVSPYATYEYRIGHPSARMMRPMIKQNLLDESSSPSASTERNTSTSQEEKKSSTPRNEVNGDSDVPPKDSS
mmetsp:Transcript_15997/g.27914  ORF Transcript_15997/g.27914 Transcript_15997/m.27914 type:complete len:250 (+) Transcript_15997:66-815(+)